MSSIAALASVTLNGLEMATWCQRAENACVGAPCGIMDQCASALGREAELLQLLCRPSVVQGSLPLPPHLAVWCALRRNWQTWRLQAAR
jgi:L-arabinokinase